jgi:hypothetical protein
MSETNKREFHIPEFKARAGLKFSTAIKPDVVCRTASGGGAVLVDKFPRAAEDCPVEHSGTGQSSTATATTRAKTAPEQRRPAANKVECTV